MAEEGEAPWHVEVPQSRVSFLLGPDGTTLKRLSRATGCDLEVERQRRGSGTKSVSYGGQTQYYEADGENASDEGTVKVFVRGVPRRRLLAAELLAAVAAGEDPEDHAARAEGALVLGHELGGHPEREAWARWRLLSVSHGHGAAAHVGRRSARLAPASGGAFAEDAAAALQAAAQEVFRETEELVELRVEALDRLEPEESPTDPAVAPLVDQYGVIVRVCDQDDNAVSEFITVRLFGPPAATADAAQLLTARFVRGKATASVLQVPGQVQGMPAEHLADFGGDLRELEAECQVKVHKGATVLWVEGDDAAKVGEARKMLQEMLQYYLPSACHLVEGLGVGAVEALLQDQELGVLMARPGCAVMVDESAGSLWVCGSEQRASVLRRVEAARSAAASGCGGAPAAKRRRRTCALSFHSEVH